MEQSLRCNSLKCRAELREEAVVATCSHIYCADCANKFGLTSPNHNQRVCPACHTTLPHGDDVIIQHLKPSEDYKSSVLSGLSPSIIIECASRALSFWAYQMTQETTYQNHVGKSLSEKYSSLSAHLDKTINDANSEISGLHSKMTGLSLDYDTLRRQNEELVQAMREKNKKLLQTQELYDKLKRKAMLSHIQEAATDAVDSSIHAGRFTSMGGPDSQPAMSSLEQQTGTPYAQSRQTNVQASQASQHHQTRSQESILQDHSWHRPAVTQAFEPARQMFGPATPSSRRPNGIVSAPGVSTVPGIVIGTPVCGPGQTRPRPFQHSNYDGFERVGLTSGLRTSQPATNVLGLTATTRAPGFQRPPVPLFNSQPISQRGFTSGVHD